AVSLPAQAALRMIPARLRRADAPSRPLPIAHPPSADEASPKGPRMSRSTSSHTAPQPTVSVTAASPPTPSLISARLPRRAAVAALLVPLAACAGDRGDPRSDRGGDGGGDGAGAVEGSPSDSTVPTDSLTVADPWVKAAEEGMSSCFGTLLNGTEQDL